MDGPAIMTGSLRRAALIWITGLLTIVGLATMLLAHDHAREEAAEFLGGLLRMIALNAGTGLSPAPGPAAANS